MNLLITAGLILAAIAAGPDQKWEPRWYKGNLHTHTWWSDGDSPPETVVAWYKEHGYQFLSITDHNDSGEDDRWIDPARSLKATTAMAAAAYAERYGPSWVEKKADPVRPDGPMLWRAKPLSEIRPLFEEAGKFLLITGEELSDVFEKMPVHLCVFNIRDVIGPQKGKSVSETLQNNIQAATAQSEKTGRLMPVQINHPNFKWGLTAEDIAPTKGAVLLEVANGHNGVNNAGDREHPSVEYIWDVVLTRRLGELNLPIMYGTATDDAHFFTGTELRRAIPGRGWVMVRAGYLTPERILRSLERGDFYASTGVTLKDVKFEKNVLSVAIEPKPGVSYRTQFIGTLKGYDPKATPRSADPNAHVTMKYSDDVGRVLAEQAGTKASYKLTGQELYVRARIASTVRKENPAVEGDLETAWVQPVRPQAGK